MPATSQRCLGIFLLAFWGISQGADPSKVVVGRVLCADTEKPLEGGRVGIQGSACRVRTDRNGQFELSQQPRPGDRIVAWHSGYFIGGVAWSQDSELSISLRPLPAKDSPNYEWVDPGPDPAAAGNCANCHAEIYRQWAISSHAQAAVNRHFLNVFNGEDWEGRPNTGWNFRRDQPDALAVCSACHLPSVPADHPAAADPTRARGVAREGIHCDFCHKIADTEFRQSLDSLGLQHGRDALSFLRPAGGEQLFFGPLDDVDQGRDTYAPLYRSSYYCASCHEGTLFGTRVYETFSEWRDSAYAKRGVECQHCHMTPDGKMHNMAPGHGGIEREPGSLATHHFPGSMDEPLLKSCVELTLSADRLPDRVRVTVSGSPKNVGHKLPTGAPDRHLILVVRAVTRSGTMLRLQEGPTVSDAGAKSSKGSVGYAGQPGKIYGKLLRGADGSTPAPFWRAVGTEFDTRLGPDQTDQTSFTFLQPESAEPIQVEASLVYRRFYRPVLEQKSWPDHDMILAQARTSLEPR